jgi:phospholipid-translocating ATPase
MHLSDPESSVFIRTDQLDGETDWKMRIPIQFFQKLSDKSLANAGVTVSVEAPHKDIYRFEARLASSRVESASIENSLWMNTILASQGSVIGLVVYTGADTRVAVMNTSFPCTKVGLLDLEINRLSKVISF